MKKIISLVTILFLSTCAPLAPAETFQNTNQLNNVGNM